MREINLLLVEDNDDDRFLTMRILKKLPLQLKVEIARNGEDALLRLFGPENAPPPSLILLDLQLPKVGGIHFLARVREQFSPAVLPVIILSSSDNPGDIKLCNELGISGYLSKPLEAAALEALLEASAA
jgi:CheY-like chemotaxis protein